MHRGGVDDQSGRVLCNILLQGCARRGSLLILECTYSKCTPIIASAVGNMHVYYLKWWMFTPRPFGDGAELRNVTAIPSRLTGHELIIGLDWSNLRSQAMCFSLFVVAQR